MRDRPQLLEPITDAMHTCAKHLIGQGLVVPDHHVVLDTPYSVAQFKDSCNASRTAAIEGHCEVNLAHRYVPWLGMPHFGSVCHQSLGHGCGRREGDCYCHSIGPLSSGKTRPCFACRAARFRTEAV